jgi:hypothetical protein
MFLPFSFPLTLLVFISSMVTFLVTLARNLIHPMSDPYGTAVLGSLRLLFV